MFCVTFYIKCRRPLEENAQTRVVPELYGLEIRHHRFCPIRIVPRPSVRMFGLQSALFARPCPVISVPFVAVIPPFLFLSASRIAFTEKSDAKLPVILCKHQIPKQKSSFRLRLKSISSSEFASLPCPTFKHQISFKKAKSLNQRETIKL